MVKHFIIMASAYSKGKRIALDYSSESSLDMGFIQKEIDSIFEKCGKDAPISTHYIQTDGFGWNQVGKLDKFFESAELVETKEEFIRILLNDRTLKGIDIARYILTKYPCTHLKLEKLVYMCYADYLCESGKKLFEDNIYAYKLGPVIESVYEKYRKSGTEMIETEDDIHTYEETTKMMPIRSRILSSADGLKKLISIDKTLRTYGSFTARGLVNITHGDNTPWSMSGAGQMLNGLIKDELIIKYHKYEQ